MTEPVQMMLPFECGFDKDMEAWMKLPDIELVADAVHANWMESKARAGVTSRKLETGEELMVPYALLSEEAKELDRGTVRTVYMAVLKIFEENK